MKPTNSPSQPQPTIPLTIERLADGGRGLTFHDGRVVFIPYTTPGDVIDARLVTIKKRHAIGELVTLREPGPHRVEPLCRHYGACGGCQMQHLDETTQHDAKRQYVIDPLTRIGGVARDQAEACVEQTCIASPATGYRCRASLKIRWVRDRALVGFFAPNSHRVTDLKQCPVLDPKLFALIDPLRRLIGELSLRERLPQADLTCGDGADEVAVILHVLRTPNGRDRAALERFAERTGIAQLWLQTGRKEGMQALINHRPLRYGVTDLQLTFQPGDFTQANPAVNRWMVAKAMEWAGRGKRALDLFCGLGNFTLPLAQQFEQVLGLESYAPAVARGKENARALNLTNARFEEADLFNAQRVSGMKLDEWDLIVCDPPRDGATLIAQRLVEAGPERLIWIACDPAAFARDARTLIGGGYTLEEAIPLEMFPQTGHVELMARFTKCLRDVD
ncbi:23S rRNA (uracil(1939)-C(5))-methyltransferase RlmD [Magnetofaba australis]|nr:23S rRNA (uracil(1939)-C(5))-methyltransferase RlmD [Magnetofaba australis]